MEKISIGFLGCGSIAKRHLQSFQESGQAEIKFLFDPNRENVNKFASQIEDKVTIFDSAESLVKKGQPDGIVICSPHTIHLQQIKLALENGIDVLVEKPAVVTAAETEELKEVLKKTGKNLVVAYQRHYQHPFISAKEIIQQGNLGNIFFISGYLSQDWIRL
jgi:predicted dehydrogenase